MIYPVEQRTLKFLAEACSGKLVNVAPHRLATGFCTDSRKVSKDHLFVALKGDRFDAHDFVPQVLSAGAIAAVVERKSTSSLPQSGSYLVVENCRRALGEIAARYRQDFDIPFVVVGGSNGKTSTKELLAAVLGAKLNTLSSEGSFNNDVGVPVTLLRLSNEHQAAVLEVGSNHPGELAPLLRMVQPQIGIITSIGREHLEFFGSLEGVVKEESEVAQAVPANGLLLIDGDSPHAPRLVQAAKCKVLKLGFADGNDVQVCAFEMHSNGTNFTLRMHGSTETYRMNLIGRHQLINASYAIVVGKELGLGRSEIQSGLDRARPAKMRLELMQAGGLQILNDAYNANADSMIAALNTLRDFPGVGKKIAVLGNMAELGNFSEESHREVGLAAAAAGLHMLLTVGTEAALIAESAGKAGMRNVHHFADIQEAVNYLLTQATSGDLILLKGSRSSRMERVVDLIQSAFSGIKEGVL